MGHMNPSMKEQQANEITQAAIERQSAARLPLTAV